MPHTGTGQDARQERNRQIVKRVAAGEKLAALARDFGLTPERIRQICINAELRLGDLRRVRNREIVRRVAAGEHYTSVAQDIGLSSTYVSTICQSMGFDIRRRHDLKERNRRIVGRVIDGEKRKVIAKDFGLTPEQISVICRRAGIRVKDRRLSTKDRQERDRQIVKRVAAGETRTSVAKDFRLTPGHIGLICRNAGLHFDGQQLNTKARQDRDQQIVKRVAAGETRTSVAKDFGLTTAYASLICRQAGLRIKEYRPRLSTKEQQERDQQIVKRVAAGETRTSVAKDFGLTPAYASLICRQAGLRVKEHRLQLSAKERQERDQQIVKRVAAGETRTSVAKDFGLTPGYASLICRQAGLSLKDRKLQLSVKERQERDQQIVKRVAAGETRTSVAKDFGLTPGYASLICRQAGLSLKDRKLNTKAYRNVINRLSRS